MQAFDASRRYADERIVDADGPHDAVERRDEPIHPDALREHLDG